MEDLWVGSWLVLGDWWVEDLAKGWWYKVTGLVLIFLVGWWSEVDGHWDSGGPLIGLVIGCQWSVACLWFVVL